MAASTSKRRSDLIDEHTMTAPDNVPSCWRATLNISAGMHGLHAMSQFPGIFRQGNLKHQRLALNVQDSRTHVSTESLVVDHCSALGLNICAIKL